MSIDKKLLNTFLLVLFLGWFYSGAVWLLLDVLGIKEYLEIQNPWDIIISCSIGHALTATQAASIIYKRMI